MSKKPIQYTGRKTTRQSSEQRRKAILKAVLRLVIRDGARAVKHRAVAREADVPLSATTYYFKDINGLIVDAFTFFVESSLQTVVLPIQENVAELIAEQVVARNQGVSDAFLGELSALLANHIDNQLRYHREHLVVEQAFLYEAIRHPRLNRLVTDYYQHLVMGMVEICKQIGVEEPQTAADLVMNTIFRLEYEGLLLDNPDEFDVDRARSILHRQLKAFIPDT